MAVPDFQSIMLPLLQALQDGQTHRYADVAEHLAGQFQLTESERVELLPSGQRRFLNRVAWARTYLAKAGLLESSGRGSIQITDAGRSLLAERPQRIDIRLLSRYPDFVAFRERTAQPVRKNGGSTPEEGGGSTETPQELIERASRQLQATLAEELLATIKAQSPGFFEKLVLQLLVRMGYGGSLEDAGRVVGQTGDGGIDGVIKEDKLGLDMIYIQAKKWDSTVGRPVVQGFAGSLDGYQARKGVFITTGTFSRDAQDYVDRIDKRIVLIDGPMLAQLLIEHDVGVTVTSSLQIKRLDSDYFSEE
jgi:restriction system protein